MSKTPYPSAFASRIVTDDRRILAIALPAILANSAAPMVGLLDTWTLANFAGTSDLAAIGAGSIVFSFLLWAFGFLRMGTTGLVAQAAGRTDKSAVAQLTIQSLLIGFVLGLAILLLSGPLQTGSLWLLDVPSGVERPFTDYFTLRILSAPLTLATYGVTGVLLGLERARAVLVLQLVLNVSNGLLNILFVIGLDMGASGVALGTVIAEALTLATGVGMMLKNPGKAALFSAFKAGDTWAPGAMLTLVRVNGLLFVRTIILLTVFFVVTRQSAQFGTEALAASHVINTFLLLISLGLDAFAYAAEALTGAAYGSGDRHAFNRWSMRCGVWSVAAAVLYTATFALFWDMIASGLIPEDSTDVFAILVAAKWLLIVMPLVGIWSYLFDGIFVGATASFGMMATMALSAAGFFLLLPWGMQDGVVGIWTVLVIFLGFRGLSQALYYPLIVKRLKKA